MGTLGPKEEETGYYISRSALETYFDSPLKIREILNDLLPSQYLDAEYIWQYYRRGFAILLSIDEGRMIRQFVEYSTLQDKHLPFLGPPPADFPASSDGKLFTSFYKRQWKYLPMELVYRMRGPIPPDMILPIRVKEKLGRGVSANVHKIEVDREYNRLGHSVGEATAKGRSERVDAQAKADSSLTHPERLILSSKPIMVKMPKRISKRRKRRLKS